MNLDTLSPAPDQKRPFRRSHQKFVPDRSGCYVLATFLGVVLYVGLADDLRRRMGEHLDNPEKTSPTHRGRAVWFHWLEIEAKEIKKVERTWMNIHCQEEGALPELNRVYSPTST